MKKLTLILTALTCALALTAQAGDKKKVTDEQQKLQTELLGKYDADKNGKIDKEERAKVSTEDKAKMEKAGLIKEKKKDK